MEKKNSAWVIIDNKTGNASQAIAVAEVMGINYEIKKLKYNFLGHLPNWLKFDSLIGIDLKESSNINEPYPDLIISSGRKTAAVSSYIKKMNPQTFVVHLMHPDLPFENFDLVALPFHDLSEKYANITNISYTIGAPSYLNKDKLKKAGEELLARIPELKGPFITLIIGGENKKGNYKLEELQALVKQSNELAAALKGSLLVSTSRRTSQEMSKHLRQEITVPCFFYDWHFEEAKNNPYLGFLALSDYIIVTGDSVSICSEALSTGKPVYVYRKDEILYKKHIKFLDYLEQLHYTKNLEDKISKLEIWEYPPLQEAEKLGKIIKEKLNNARTNISSKDTRF